MGVAVNTDEKLCSLAHRSPLAVQLTIDYYQSTAQGLETYKPLESSGVLSMSHLLSPLGSAMNLILLPTPNILVCWACLCIWLMNLSSVTLHNEQLV